MRYVQMLEMYQINFEYMTSRSRFDQRLVLLLEGSCEGDTRTQQNEHHRETHLFQRH